MWEAGLPVAYFPTDMKASGKGPMAFFPAKDLEPAHPYICPGRNEIRDDKPPDILIE